MVYLCKMAFRAGDNCGEEIKVLVADSSKKRPIEAISRQTNMEQADMGRNQVAFQPLSPDARRSPNCANGLCHAFKLRRPGLRARTIWSTLNK
jgi:hypothetical protein